MRQARGVRVLAASAAMIGCLFVPPQQSVQDPTRWEVDAGEHPVQKLIDSAARFLGRNLLYAPDELQKCPPIELQRKLELDPAAAEDVFSQLLFTRGLALVPRDPLRGVWEIINLNGPRRTEAANHRLVVSADEIETLARRKVHVVTRVRTEHVNAHQAAQMLRPFLAGMSQTGLSMSIGSVADSSLLLSGFADDVAAAVRLVRMSDLPPAQPDKTVADRLAAVEARLAALETSRVAAPAQRASGPAK